MGSRQPRKTAAPKAAPAPTTKVVRIDPETYAKVKASCETEKRTLSAQLSVLVDRGLAATEQQTLAASA